ncbi:MAG TPA: hypothetical protein VK911_01115 [Vicinamibacterales bacterium]|nr:hypothetical protein [Vicinamibacterales bacterium]
MMTNAPDHTAATRDSHAEESPGPRPGIVGAALTWVQQGMCGLHGHDLLLQYERNRIYLRCTSCGRETPGWDVSRAPLSARLRNEGTRPAADLTVVRKIA